MGTQVAGVINEFLFITAVGAAGGTQTWDFAVGAASTRVNGFISVTAAIDCTAGG